MDKQKSALTISIIALIISIIALLLVLWLGYGCCSQCCKKSHECPQKEEPAAAAVVEKTEAEPAQASMGEEVIVETVKPHEDVVVKKKGGVQYIDLGLPSGTLWANVNDANGLTTYGVAEPEERRLQGGRSQRQLHHLPAHRFHQLHRRVPQRQQVRRLLDLNHRWYG